MPTVLHPRALEETDGRAPARVVVGGTRYVIDQETGTVDLDSEDEAEALAEAHGVDREAIDPADEPVDHDPDTCTVTKNDGEVCGRDLPCPYHPGD